MDSNILTTVVFEISRQCFAMPTSIIHEFVDTGSVRVSVVPGCQPPCIGIIQHRSHVIPVIDLRLVFGFPAFEQELESVRAMIRERQRDHRAWIEELERCCSTGAGFNKPVDHRECAFGRWYDQLRASSQAMNSITGGDSSLKVMIDAFDEPHRRVHAIAETALSLAASGDTDGATALIEQTKQQELAQLDELFAGLPERMRERRKSRLVIGEVRGEPVALLVDSIRAIRDIPTDSIQCLDTREIRNPMIQGVFSCEVFGELCVMDTDALTSVLSATPKSGHTAAA